MLSRLPVSVVIVILVGIPPVHQAAAQEFRACAKDDFRCLEQLAEHTCSRTVPSTGDCIELIDELQLALTATPTPELANALGIANFLLSFRAQEAGDIRARAEFLNAAESANEEAIRLDPDFTAGYMGLAGVALHEERLNDRIHWLRQAASSSDNFMHTSFLAHALMNEVGTPAARREAAQLLEDARVQIEN